MTNRSHSWVRLLGAVFLAGCNGSSGPNTQPDSGPFDRTDSGPFDRTDAGPGIDGGQCGTAASTEFAGPYSTTGTWDVSGPLNADRRLGDLLADLVVEEVVGLLGVPGFLEDEAAAAVDALIGDAIRDAVNGSAIETFLRTDPLMQSLLGLTAQLQVTSEIELEASETPGELSGREEITSFGVELDGTVYRLNTPSVLAGSEFAIPLAAEWSGAAGASALSVDEHEFSLRYGELLLWIVSEAIGNDALTAFGDRVVAAVDCPALIAPFTDANGDFSISVGGFGFSISGDSIVKACQEQVRGLVDRAFGLFEIDSGIRVGGGVTLLDADCNGVADGIESQADYGGIVAIVGPDAIQPRVAVSFTGGRGARYAYADMRNGLGSVDEFPVRGRLVYEYAAVDPAATQPYRELFQQEIRNGDVELSIAVGESSVPLGTVRADGEGYLDSPVSIAGMGIGPGRYTVEVRYGGSVAGSYQVRLLDRAHAQPVIRSDIDLTYLESDFASLGGLLDLVSADSGERAPLSGMNAFYQEASQGSPGGVSLAFLTGSPRFFARTMEGRMQIDGFEQDGVVLKPFKDIVIANLLDLTFGEIVPELKEQIGYKLHALLVLRLELPGSTPELLLGDDSEADYVVYSLYSRFLAGRLTSVDLMGELNTLGVASAWQDEIAPLLDPVTAHVTASVPVEAIYIRRTGHTPAYTVANFATAEMRYHNGTWPMALDFFEQGWLAQAAVERVRTAMLAAGDTDADLRAAAADGVSQGFIDQVTVDLFHP